MNGFEKHKIGHLSASSINLWTNAPDLWVAKYLHGHKQAFGPAPRRGQVVETLVHDVLTGTKFEKAEKAALARFDRDFPFADEATTKERDLIAPMAEIAIAELEQYGLPDAGGDEQHRISITADFGDWSIPVIGFLDFTFPEHGLIVDLKTSGRMPSKMSMEHQRQAAIYQAAMGNQKVRFLYVTGKKAGWLECDDVQAVLRETKNHIRRLECFLRLHNAEEALACVPANQHNFYWRGDREGWEKHYAS